ESVQRINLEDFGPQYNYMSKGVIKKFSKLGEILFRSNIRYRNSINSPILSLNKNFRILTPETEIEEKLKNIGYSSASPIIQSTNDLGFYGGIFSIKKLNKLTKKPVFIGIGLFIYDGKS